MDTSIISFLSAANLIAVIVCVFYAKKIYDFTRGATDFWLYFCAFIFSLGGFTIFDILINFSPLSYVSPFMAVKDLSMVFASIFAFVSVIYLRRMFEEMIGEKI